MERYLSCAEYAKVYATFDRISQRGRKATMGVKGTVMYRIHNDLPLPGVTRKDKVGGRWILQVDEGTFQNHRALTNK